MSSPGHAGGPVRVRLYVAGDSPNSVKALANVRSALEEHPGHQVSLEVIDVVRDPERGARDAILATPLLVRFEPLPERRALGNLQDRGLLLGVLCLNGSSRE